MIKKALEEIKTIFFSCGSSARFRVMALLYGASQTQSVDTNTHSRAPLDEWSARSRNLYLTMQHSQETDIQIPKGIQIRNRSKREAVDPRRHGDRLVTIDHTHIIYDSSS
jgi:hypothetical protein